MNKVIKNYLYNLSYQLLLIVLPIITTPYVSRVLGAEAIGTYAYTNSITQYFILFGCIGLNLYGQREIAYRQNNIGERNRVFCELVFLRTVTIIISLIVFYITFAREGQYAYIFIIQIMDIIASIFDVSWFFQGMEDFKKTVLRNFLARIVCVSLIFMFVKSSADLPLYVLFYSITLLLGNISMWFYIPKYIKRNDVKNLNIQRHIKPAVMLFLPQIASSLYTLLDKTMIGLITDNNSEVAYYEQSQIIIKTVLTLLTSLSTAMMPRIANLFATDDMETVKNYMTMSIKFILMFSFPFVLGIIGIAPGFVPWFYGNGFEKVIPNLMLISSIIIFIGLSAVTGTQYLLALGRQREYTFSIIAAAIVNLILNLILIPQFSSLGAAIATSFAELVALLTQIWFIRKDFNIFSILKQGFRYLVFSLIMFVVVFGISNFLSMSIVSTLIEIFVGGIIYLLLLIIAKDTIFNGVRAKLAERRK